VWAASIVTRARKEGRIRDDFAVKTVIDELNKFRGQCGLLISYDTISVPLVYTQVVTLAVYSYFVTAVLGQREQERKLYLKLFLNPVFFFQNGTKAKPLAAPKPESTCTSPSSPPSSSSSTWAG
jgi:bestrophin, other